MSALRNLRTLALALCLILPFAFAPQVLGKETKEERKARKAAEKALKKVRSKFLKGVKALQRAKNDDARNKIRDVLRDFIVKIEEVNHPVAADFVLQVAPAIEDGDIFQNLSEAIGNMTNPAIPKHLNMRWEETKKRKLKLTWQQRVMVMDAYGRLSGPDVNKGCALGLLHDNAAVRQAAVKIAGNKEDKQVIDALIKVLKVLQEIGGTLYFDARQALVDLTGEDFFTHDKWAGWWESNKASFDFSKKGQKKEAATVERKEEEIPRFFGTEIKSNRALFIIDVSGSMKMTDPPQEFDKGIEEYQKQQPKEQRQRIERAKSSLLKVIKSLQKTQFFNILRYSSAIDSWQKKDILVPATESNKAAAASFVEAIREGGGTQTFDALKRAFSYKNVDTIYLLSDGAPSSGKLGNPGDQQKSFEQAEIDKIVRWVKVNNRFRRIKIFTFGFDGPGAWHKKWGPRSVTLPTDPKYISHFAEFMRDLATVTGGEYRSLK